MYIYIASIYPYPFREIDNEFIHFAKPKRTSILFTPRNLQDIDNFLKLLIAKRIPKLRVKELVPLLRNVLSESKLNYVKC